MSKPLNINEARNEALKSFFAENIKLQEGSEDYEIISFVSSYNFVKYNFSVPIAFHPIMISKVHFTESYKFLLTNSLLKLKMQEMINFELSSNESLLESKELKNAIKIFRKIEKEIQKDSLLLI